jgi:hypothetical protein
MDGLIEGRIVHFVVDAEHNIHRAAIVVNVADKRQGIVDLFVFSMPSDERGGFFMYVVALYDENKAINTWHWIEKA